MLDFITVFNPSYITKEEDAEKQLLLFHTFQEVEEGRNLSLNEKIAQLGVIQALWQFSGTFAESQDMSESVIELEDRVLCTIVVENGFFVTLGIAAAELDIPANYFAANLRHCYDFSVLQFGLWSGFTSRKQLTDRLNEFLVPFWTELNLMPHHLWYKGFMNCWPHCYKVADIEDNAKTDASSSSSSSWEADLKQQVLLDDSSFLGLQDLLIYHLPKATSGKSYKLYGLVRSFTPNFDSLPQFSNWIEHLDNVYTRLSSHVLAGNVQFKEAAEEEPTVLANNSEDLSTTQSIMDQSRKLYNNFTYPLSFAHDAVHEVGNMTGISSSMSLLSDLMPKIPSWKIWPNSDDKKAKAARSEFLISPLSASFLPESYKVKKMHLSYDGVLQSFNCLFWFYNEALVVLVYKENFGKIWDHEYLHDTHFKLSQCISKLYTSHLNATHNGVPDSFCYAIISKNTRRLRSSFPLNTAQENSTKTSTLELVVSGLDEFLAIGTNRKTSVATLHPLQASANSEDESGKQPWGLSLMGGIFKKGPADDASKKYGETFLDDIPEEKLRFLHLDINKFINTLNTSKRAPDLKEEKLIKLNNGVLCFLSETSKEIVVLVENWFDKKPSKSKRSPRDGNNLVQYMGTEVFKWWQKNKRTQT
ncbi:LAME_0E06260g1_1 [Lachancea meyersii CBS 8951]|uniref:LAME_0E06260g1_1 n=1 Tax=Lachancea meyersii CBS 8951 TaxID=1266667 RepID=A0A1G4JHT1_9SACH|nr:LAME_0E06260g1_1 [Lachancea meyersii CBS 8951]